MGQLLKPTRKEKVFMAMNGLKPDNWYIEQRNDKFLYLVNKSGKQHKLLVIKDRRSKQLTYDKDHRRG